MAGRMRFSPVLLALVLVFVAIPLERHALGGPARQDNQPALQPRLINIRGERLLGVPIINREGKRIGEVGDLLVNIVGQRQSGNPQQPARGGMIANARVDYILAQYGGVLGWDKETVPLPLAALRLHLVDAGRLGFDDDLVFFEGNDPGDDALAARKEFFNQNALVLASEQDLDNVPRSEMDRFDDVADPSWDRSLRAFWQGLGAAWPQATAENGAAYRINGIRDLSRFSLRELGGDGLGWVDDGLVTFALANPVLAPVPALGVSGTSGSQDNSPDDEERANANARALAASLPIVDARVHYVLVGHGGWWGLGARTTPVPFNGLMMDRDYDERNLYLEADEGLLEDAPAINGKEGNELNDGNFFTRVRSYWEQAGFGSPG